MADVPPADYERIGRGYAVLRRPDPRLAGLLAAALGGARSVVDVGAGTGSYEPADRHVVAIEPSDVMAAQRPPELAPALRLSAAELPLRDASVDAAMAVLTVHHWGAEQERGVRELRRVARGPVLVVTYDAEVSGRMWLPAEYVPEVAEADRRLFPEVATLDAWLGGGSRAEVVPVDRDSPDWTFGAFWAHPERVLDPAARAVTSGFARLAPSVVARAVDALAADLASGAWDGRHGDLRHRQSYVAGLRLLVHPGA